MHENTIKKIFDDNNNGHIMAQKFSMKLNNDIYKLLDNMPIMSYDNLNLIHTQILLDTRNRNLAYTDYSWNLAPFSSIQSGNINCGSTISNIVEIGCGNFKIPIALGTNMQYYKKIRVGIKEFENQGTEIITNTKYTTRSYYHFEFNTTSAGSDYLELECIKPWRPNKTINICDRITLIFYGNTEKIEWPVDNMLCTYTSGSPVVFTSPQPHNLNTGDLIYINSGELENKQGYYAIVNSAVSFSITGTAVQSGSVNVYFAQKRIQLQMNFIMQSSC